VARLYGFQVTIDLPDGSHLQGWDLITGSRTTDKTSEPVSTEDLAAEERQYKRMDTFNISLSSHQNSVDEECLEDKFKSNAYLSEDKQEKEDALEDDEGGREEEAGFHTSGITAKPFDVKGALKVHRRMEEALSSDVGSSSVCGISVSHVGSNNNSGNSDNSSAKGISPPNSISKGSIEPKGRRKVQLSSRLSAMALAAVMSPTSSSRSTLSSSSNLDPPKTTTRQSSSGISNEAGKGRIFGGEEEEKTKNGSKDAKFSRHIAGHLPSWEGEQSKNKLQEDEEIKEVEESEDEEDMEEEKGERQERERQERKMQEREMRGKEIEEEVTHGVSKSKSLDPALLNLDISRDESTSKPAIPNIAALSGSSCILPTKRKNPTSTDALLSINAVQHPRTREAVQDGLSSLKKGRQPPSNMEGNLGSNPGDRSVDNNNCDVASGLGIIGAPNVKARRGISIFSSALLDIQRNNNINNKDGMNN